VTTSGPVGFVVGAVGGVVGTVGGVVAVDVGRSVGMGRAVSAGRGFEASIAASTAASALASSFPASATAGNTGSTCFVVGLHASASWHSSHLSGNVSCPGNFDIGLS